MQDINIPYLLCSFYLFYASFFQNYRLFPAMQNKCIFRDRLRTAPRRRKTSACCRPAFFQVPITAPKDMKIYTPEQETSVSVLRESTPLLFRLFVEFPELSLSVQ